MIGPTGIAARRTARIVTRGALDTPTMSAIGRAHRSTSTVTTTVKTALPRGAPAMGRSLVRAYPEGRDRRDHEARAGAPHRGARPRRARGLLAVHAPGLGRPRARPAPSPDRAVRRGSPADADRGVPR